MPKYDNIHIFSPILFLRFLSIFAEIKLWICSNFKKKKVWCPEKCQYSEEILEFACVNLLREKGRCNLLTMCYVIRYVQFCSAIFNATFKGENNVFLTLKEFITEFFHFSYLKVFCIWNWSCRYMRYHDSLCKFVIEITICCVNLL